MPINDSEARTILRQWDTRPEVLQVHQAIAKALTLYGFPGAAGVAYGDNNWFAIPGATNPGGAGTCLPGSVPFPVQPTANVPTSVCHRVFATPEDGITAMLLTWFPPQADGTSGPEGTKWAGAITNRDTATIAQMVVQRAWGIPRRGVSFAQLGSQAATLFAADLYQAAREIAQNLGEPLLLNAPPDLGLAVLPATQIAQDLLQTLPIVTNLPTKLPAPPTGSAQNNAGSGQGSLATKAESFLDKPVAKVGIAAGLLFGVKKLFDWLK